MAVALIIPIPICLPMDTLLRTDGFNSGNVMT